MALESVGFCGCFILVFFLLKDKCKNDKNTVSQPHNSLQAMLMLAQLHLIGSQANTG